MPSIEVDAVPLADLLRTGEASRLRRRGAMRSGHRREDSLESLMPPSRRVRLEAAVDDDPVSLQLSCGVRTHHFSTDPSSSSHPSYLPNVPYSVPLSNLAFAYKSTGCDAVVCCAALPAQQTCSSPHHVYISTDTSNPDVATLHSRYLDHSQRSIADFLSRKSSGCLCNWEAIGCRQCGNPLGFLHVPCHPLHSIGSKTNAPTRVFFPSAVTPSPSHTFSINHDPQAGLPRRAAPSESGMSLDSPTFSPYPVFPPEDAPGWPIPEDDDFEYVDPSRLSTSRASAISANTSNILPFPTTPAPERTSNHPQEDPDFDRVADNSHWSSRGPRRTFTETRQSEARTQTMSRSSTRHDHSRGSRSRVSRDVSDDEWSTVPERDHVPVTVRRPSGEHTQRTQQNAWLSRGAREQPPSALVAGEWVPDRLAQIRYPEPPERDMSQNATATRSPDPPSLHRVARRHMGSLMPPGRRPAFLDASPWRTRSMGMIPGVSRPSYERQEQRGDGDRELRMSRWATGGVGANGHLRRAATVTATTTPPASAPAASFTLVDSTGETSYPPSARSSVDDRDTLSVESSPEVGWVNYTSMMVAGVYDVWGEHEEAEVDDEEKVEEEQFGGEGSAEGRQRRSPFVMRSRELVLDEQSVSSVSQLPLG